jgi:hypothetical protein
MSLNCTLKQQSYDVDRQKNKVFCLPNARMAVLKFIQDLNIDKHINDFFSLVW